MTENKSSPRILVFSTNPISDVGIDLAGSSHMDYPTSVQVIPIPCSSGINPQWILHAIQSGFDGVFIAADGGDCGYVSDCTARTGRVVGQAQALLVKAGFRTDQVKMAAICSVCSEPFVNLMKQFAKALSDAPPAPRRTLLSTGPAQEPDGVAVVAAGA